MASQGLRVSGEREVNQANQERQGHEVQTAIQDVKAVRVQREIAGNRAHRDRRDNRDRTELRESEAREVPTVNPDHRAQMDSPDSLVRQDREVTLDEQAHLDPRVNRYGNHNMC